MSWFWGVFRGGLRYRFARAEDARELERFLNGLEGEVASIVPNMNSDRPGWFSYVDFLMIVGKLN